MRGVRRCAILSSLEQDRTVLPSRRCVKRAFAIAKMRRYQREVVVDIGL